LLLRDLLDETFPGITIEWRACRHQRRDLMWVARGEHRRHPAALAKPDQIDLAPQIINDGVDFGEVDVDVVVLHLIRRRLPVHAQYAPYAIRLQRLDQALALGVVGDGRVVAGIGGIDDGRYDLRVAARGGPGKIPKLHGVEIIKDLVLAGPDWLEIEFLFFFFDRKVEISLENLCR